MKKTFYLLSLISCFAIVFSSCQKEFSIENGDTQIAEGSLADSSGNCISHTVVGTFYGGVAPGGDTAYVEVQVNVTQTGSYKIYTDLQDGFKFGDSGFFANAGINTIRLKPIGTPIIPVSTLFNVSFDSSSCSFFVDIQDSTGTNLGGQDTVGNGDPDSVPDNSWQFTANGQVFQGSIINAQYGVATLVTELVLIGQMQSNSPDTTFGLSVEFPGNTLDTGTYQTTANGTNFSLSKTIGGDIIFGANSTSTQILTIDVKSYDAATKIVSGTFSGNAYDFDGNNTLISNGIFKATIQ